jgi:hypothetical protein
MEANGDERGLEEDSSDDEDDPLVPIDWDNYNFSQLSVNPGENVAWCDNPIWDNSVLSPKPLHLVIKR